MSDSSAVTVEVALRVRPLVQNEISRGCQQCVESDGSGSQVVVRGNRYFAYNYVFGTDDSQTYFYETAVKKLVNRLFHGYNVTILAYGQTGSGKTYSMGTCYSGEKDAGIIPRSIKDIFDTVAQKTDWEYNITVSFMELYKEQLFDLLADNRNPVEIREENKEIRVSNLTEVTVLNADDTTKCLMQGSAGRATGATAMNTQSSRSHAIFTITIHQQKTGDTNSAMTAKFHLVDLAGSERSKKTQATGERFKEGIDINKGLLALGNVISALGDEGPRGFISYRDSKLTRLLQDSLGGNSITLMIACVSPADYNLDETMSTLRYADRARRIKNKPVINQDARAAELAKYKLMVRELQLELVNRGITGGSCPAEHKLMEQENAILVAKNRCLNESLNNALSDSTYLVERALMAEMSRERMKTKLCELQAEYGQTMEHLNLTVDQTVCPGPLLEQLKEIHNKIHDLQAEQKRGTDEILKHEISNASVCKQDGLLEDAPYSADIDQRHELHAIEQQGLSKELQELNRALALKEELALKMAANSHHMRNIQPSESNMKEMEEQIATLQQEKDRLVLDLKNMQVNANSSKVAEARRKRLQELEQKIASLTKKVNEQAKVIRMNEQAEKKIIILNNEIQSMKHTKVTLIRQMRSGNEEFRDWKKKRLQEISRLKDQDRKRQVEMVRMERLHTKQQNVLKRKWEEAASANKRLKDALAVQKQNKDRRMNNASTLNKVQTWLSQELEVAVSTVEAQRTLEQLLDDRASLFDDLGALSENLKDKCLSASALAEMKKEIKTHEEDIELRNMQIDDLQQKIMDSDQANKCKSRWDTVTCMLEAKIAMNYLFDILTDAKKELSNKDYKMKELDDAHLQAVEKLEHYEQQLRNSENLHKGIVMNLEKEHEEKLFVLLRQLNGKEVPTNEEGLEQFSEREKILHDEFEKLEVMKEELEKRDEEIRQLKSKIAMAEFNGNEPSLFPAAVALPTTKPTKKTSVKKSSSEVKASPSEDYLYEYDEESFEECDNDSDPDWKKTPIFKRMQKIKSTNRPTTVSDDLTMLKRKSDGQFACGCRGLCRNNVCRCQKNSMRCSKNCKCDHTVCENQEKKDARKNILEDLSCGSGSDENQGDEDSFKKPRMQPLKENVSMLFNSTTPFKKPRLTEGRYFDHDIV